jgi:hypothetical protein
MADDRGPSTGEAPDDTDWAAYYRATLGREPRPLFARAMEAAAGVTPGRAVELGFGDGTETLALLAAGWRVLAIDAAPQAADVLRRRVPTEAAPRLEVRTAPAEQLDLPEFDLLYAGYTLPFLAREAFERVWAEARRRMAPGVLLAVNLFGTRDTWAGEPGMLFFERDAVERLIDGLDIWTFDEVEEDGPSFRGPKHWHVFDIIAARPEPGRLGHAAR